MSDYSHLKIAVFGNAYQDPYLAQLDDLFSKLWKIGIKIDIEKHFFEYLQNRIKNLKVNDVVEAPDSGYNVVLSIGGDGTFLHTAQWVGDKEIPILGINTGHLGFLSMYRLEETDDLIDSLTNNRLQIERRSLLKVSSPNLPEDVWQYALNEVAILKQDTSSMISVRTTVDDFFLADYLVDGLIVATPTGSTGYNLSVGGPILQPTVDNWVLSPIAPHTLTMRPLVLDANSEISAVTTSRVDTYRVSLDGRSFSLPCESEIKIGKAPFSILVMRRLSDNFATTLRDKLLWSKR